MRRGWTKRITVISLELHMLWIVRPPRLITYFFAGLGADNALLRLRLIVNLRAMPATPSAALERITLLMPAQPLYTSY
jgi:hypothetical protein